MHLHPMRVHNMAANRSGYLVDRNLVPLPAPFDTRDHVISLTTSQFKLLLPLHETNQVYDLSIVAQLDAFAADAEIPQYPIAATLDVKRQVVGSYLGIGVLV